MRGSRRRPKTKHHKSKKRMPANVKQYFQNLSSGMSKAEARKEAGLPPAKKRKPWGPGHPLYDYQHAKK